MQQALIVRDLKGAELGRFRDMDEFLDTQAPEFFNQDVELEFVPVASSSPTRFEVWEAYLDHPIPDPRDRIVPAGPGIQPAQPEV